MKWAILTPCDKPTYAYVVADTYESALAKAGKWFTCCRDQLEVEKVDSDNYEDFRYGRR